MTARVKPGSGKKVEEMARSSRNSDDVRAVHAVGQRARSDQPHALAILYKDSLILEPFNPQLPWCWIEKYAISLPIVRVIVG